MKYLSTFLFFCCVSIYVQAQFLSQRPTMVLDTAHRTSLGLSADVFANSDALTATVSNGFLQGGYISREERNTMLNRADENNVEGSRGYLSMYYAQRIDSIFNHSLSGVNVFFQAKHRIDNYATFSKNALTLALFGNKTFAGKNTTLTPLSYTELQYQQFQIGFAKNTNNQFSYYLGASLLVGQKARKLHANAMNLYVAETGDTLSLGAIGHFEESNPINNSFLGNNGIGASLDFGITMPFQIFGENYEPSILSLSVSDLGFISWYSSAQRTTIDTLYSYYGAEFTNIFDPAAVIFNQDPGVILDSLTTQENKSFTTSLPATISASLQHHHLKWDYNIQGTFRSQAHYKPFFALSATRALSANWKLGGQLNTGGYGTIGGGIFAKYSKNKIHVTVGSHQIEGFILPKKTAGQQLFLLLSYTI